VVGAVLAFATGAVREVGAQPSLTEGYRLIDTWQSREPGGEIARFHQPVGVDVAPDETVFVVDQQDNSVTHIDRAGGVLGNWKCDAALGEPGHVSASRDRVYVTGWNGVEIRAFDGRLVRSIALMGATGVDVGPDGRVYVSRHTGTGLQGDTRIDILDADGNVVETWLDDPFTILAPRGLAVGPDGAVYLGADGVVYVLRRGAVAAGLRVPAPLEGGDIVDVTVDGDDRVLALQAGSNARRVAVWTASSAQWRGSCDIAGAQALAAGPGTGLVLTVQAFGGFTGLTYVLDRDDLCGDRQNLGDADPTLGQVDGPRRIATAADGDVFFVDLQGRVQHWTAAGGPRQSWPAIDAVDYLSDVAGGGDLPCVVGNRTLACLGAGQRTVWSATPSADGWLVAGDGSATEFLGVDLAEQKVRRYARGGQPIGQWDLSPAIGFVSVADIAVDNDTLYYVDRGARRVKAVGLGGQSRGIEIEVPGDAERLAARDGHLYALTREGWIWKYDRTGLLKTLWRPDTDGPASDLAAGPGGRVYVADRLSDRILVYEPGGPVPTSLPARPDTRCVVNVDKHASPSAVIVGHAVDVRLTIDGACPYGDGRLDIVLAVDQSGSMTGSPLATAQAAAVAFLGQIDPAGAQVAVVGFSTTATMLQSLTGDLRSVVRAIGRLTPGGQTNYTDALDQALGELAGPRARPGVPRTLVMLTDGKPTDRTTVLRSAADLKAAGVTIYTIGLGSNLDGDLLRQVASAPDLYFEAPGEAELGNVYTTIARRIAATRLLRTGEVTDFVPSDMALVPGSVKPQADLDGGMITWSLADVRTSGTALTYQVRPRQIGHRPTNVSAMLEYVDATGQGGQSPFPVPYVDVAPEPVRAAFLPIVWRHRCQPQRADVVLVFDTSSSMTEAASPGSRQTKLGAALQAGRVFLALMQLPGDQAAIVTFDTEARLVQPLTGARGAIELSLAGITTGHGTRIDRGLGEALMEIVGDRHHMRNNPVIVILSDGLPTPGSEPALLDLALAARNEGVTVFTVGLGADADPALLARVAGDPSRALQAPQATDLGAIYRQIAGRVLCE
jgi:Mg-chelatase subunit ChlD